MLESLNVISTLCKHKKLIEKIFDARMTIQHLDRFSLLEQDDIVYLCENRGILSIDNDQVIWLNPDMEKALETLAGTGENIDLGRVDEYINSIYQELILYEKYKRGISVTKMIKYFNHIIHLFQENSKLVSKKRESDYGGNQSYLEKIDYLKHLQNETEKLTKEVDGLMFFLEKYKEKLQQIIHSTLEKKIIETYTITRDVRDTLISELESIKALQKNVNEERVSNQATEKLKIIDYLLEKRRFFAETNYHSLVAKIPEKVSFKLRLHLNSRYADSESYRERILELSQKELMSTSPKKRTKKEYQSRKKSDTPREVFYIDAREIYENFLQQESSLLHYIEQIDFEGKDYMETYLEVLEICSENLDLSKAALQETKDGRFEVLSPYILKENIV
jgi:hypothetical protein